MTNPVVIVADGVENVGTQPQHPSPVARYTATRRQDSQNSNQKLPDSNEENEQLTALDYELSVPSDQVDKGYAYAVFAAAFMTVFLTIGPAFTLGVYYNVLLKEFNASNAAVSVVPGLHVGTLLCAGAAASYLIERFGFRWTTFCGGMLASLGFVLSYFATELWHLYVTLGVISGVGAGIAHITGYGIIGFYFEKKRHVASLLFMVSSGAGCLAMAPLNEWLIENYAWRGAFLITGAVVLHTLPCGLLMHDPVLQPVNVEEYAVQLESANNAADSNRAATNALTKSSVSLALSVRSRALSSSRTDLYARHISQCREPEVLRSFISIIDDAGDSDDEASGMKADHQAAKLAKRSNDDAVTHVQSAGIELQDFVQLLPKKNSPERVMPFADIHVKARADNALLNLPDSDRKLTQNNNSQKFYSADKCTELQPPKSRTKVSLSQRLMHDECFWLIMLHSLFMGVYSYATTAIIPYAINECHFESERATLVLSSGALLSVIIRLVLAGLACTSMNKRINYFIIFHAATLLLAIAICALPYVGKISGSNRDAFIFAAYALVSAMWGLKFGVYAGIMMDVLGPKALGFVWGIASFINAFTCAAAPIVGGWLVDVTGSFTLPFVLTGILSAVAGIPMLVVHNVWLKRKKVNDLEKKGVVTKPKTG